MKRKRISRETPKQSTSRTVHLSEYVAILREHKWVAMIPFLVIVGGAIALTVLAEPVYEANALVAIEADAGAAGMIGGLQLADTMAKVDAEMEIMRSRRVAAGGVALLAEPTPEQLERLERVPEKREELIGMVRHMSDFLVEVNRYRPLEILLRTFGESRPRCTVELACPPLEGNQAAEHYEFHFVENLGRGRFALDVHKIRKQRFGSERETETVEITAGEEFVAFHRPFTLTIDGEPTGRAYGLILRSRAALTSWLQAHTIVSQMGRNTGIVALGSRAESPRLAQKAAWALALSFEQNKQTQKRYDAGRAINFLEDKRADIKSKLEAAEFELGDFQSKQGITILSEKAKLYVERISALEQERMELEIRQAEQERLLRELSKKGFDPRRVTLFAGGDDPTAAALSSQLMQLELEHSAISSTLTDEHPEVKVVRGKMKLARARLKEHLLARAVGAKELIDKRVARVNEQYLRVEGDATELPRLEQRLAKLTRDATSLAAMYNFLVEKTHEARIAQESVFSNVRIVDDPVLPSTRTSPNLLVNTVVGLFLGLLAALATAFFAEYIDRSVKTPEELENALGLPLYAALPAFKSVRSREIRQLKSPMVTIEKPHSVLSEGYRSLRANIRFADFESPVRAFAITSAVLGEGKTTTTLNLAVVLAQAGSKVLVVDADMRRPASHNHLNGELSPGLSDVLLKKQDWPSAVNPVAGVENLFVLHAGEKPPNPGALFDSEHFNSIVNDFKREYEYVLFDVPPVLAVSDAASFFRQLDALFLLVQWRRCPIDVVLAAKEQAERLGANLRGVIFNGFDARKSARRGYGHYGYYGYYGYHGKYRGYTYGYGESSSKSKSKKDKKGSRSSATLKR